MKHQIPLSLILGSALLQASLIPANSPSMPQDRDTPHSLEQFRSNGLVTSTGSWVTGDFVIGGAVKFDLHSGFVTDCEDSVTELNLPRILNGSEVSAVGYEAFLGKTGLSSVTFPDTLYTIEPGAFTGCDGLTELLMPTGLSAIGDNAFLHCTSLKNLQLSNTVESIGYRAFAYCPSLTTVHLPASLSSLNAFAFDGNVTAITVDPTSPHFSTLNGVLFDDDRTVLERYPSYRSLSHYNIPSTVLTIRDYSFADTQVNSVYIPKSVERIGAGAFSDVPLGEVYFEGTEAQWEKISISKEDGIYGGNNDALLNARIYYNATPPVSSVKEVPDWALPYLEYVEYTGIISGLNGENCDDTAIRGEVASYLYNMLGEGMDIAPLHSFEDVEGYELPIAWIQSLGYMNGESEEYFATQQSISREQFALILRQIAKEQGKDISGDSTLLYQYPDLKSISSWAVDAVAWAVDAGVMTGMDDTLNPQGNITQVQVAVMLYKFSQLP